MTSVYQCGICARASATLVQRAGGEGGGEVSEWLSCNACGASVKFVAKTQRVVHLLAGLGCVAPFAMICCLGVLIGVLQCLQRGDSAVELIGPVACPGSIALLACLAVWRLIAPTLALRRWPALEGASLAHAQQYSHAAAVPFVNNEPSVTQRQCSCGRPARCVEIEISRARGLAVGQIHKYACSSCARPFYIYNARLIAFNVFGALLLGGFGALIWLHPPGAAVGAAETNRYYAVPLLLGSVVYFCLIGVQLSRRVVHPRVGWSPEG